MKLIKNNNKEKKVMVKLSHDELRIIRLCFSSCLITSIVQLNDLEFYKKIGHTRDEIRDIVDDTIKIMDDGNIEVLV